MSIRFDPEKFVEAWQKAGSTAEVASTFGVKKGTVIQIASNYRKKGVGLKLMRKGRVGGIIDYDKLNRLAQKLYKKAS